MVDKIIAFALKEVGTKESNNGDDKYIKYYNSIAGTNLSMYVAWCCIFVIYVLRKCGVTKAVVPTMCSCTKLMNWFKSKNLFGSKPVVGALIFYDWDNDKSISEHVGIVQKIVSGYVHVFEGNYSDSVKIRKIKLTDSSIIGYAYPTYLSDVNPYTVPTRVIKLGCKGNDVKWVQYALNMTIKSGLDIDGNCGTLTVGAIRQFQTKYKLTIDGICGPETRKAMLSIL